MRHARLASYLFMVLTLAVALASPASAQDKIDNPDIVVDVKGHICPFCAFRLEMRLKKLEGIEALKVHPDEGMVAIKLKTGADIDEKQIRDAVLEAGFTVTEIRYPGKEKTAAEETETTGRRK